MASTDADLTRGSWTYLGVGPLTVYTTDSSRAALIYFGASSPALDVAGTTKIRKDSQFECIEYGGTDNVYARANFNEIKVTIIPGA